jgi:hypothetical protein
MVVVAKVGGNGVETRVGGVAKGMSPPGAALHYVYSFAIYELVLLR